VPCMAIAGVQTHNLLGQLPSILYQDTKGHNNDKKGALNSISQRPFCFLSGPSNDFLRKTVLPPFLLCIRHLVMSVDPQG
jgi:hypothetical protein